MGPGPKRISIGAPANKTSRDWDRGPALRTKGTDIRLCRLELLAATHSRLGEPEEVSAGRGRARGSGQAGLDHRRNRSGGPR
ncbi:hypothetical protein NDU88_002663 [Pleurodeles waltl]|uniref:Uncharacterized protein n=1 Tax=Pleurodeles waltl TaxID=8319 RepID=A0AAV7TLB4_PLEWA|nr:hypothetical protein NDU88_002663 [Pleurodeles waltl]